MSDLVPAYALRRVVSRRGQFVLSIESLEIESGKVTVLVGANGAGKTTLLRLLALLDTPDEGEIEFLGAAVQPRGAALVSMRRNATLVAQSPFLLHRSVRDNVVYGLAARGVKDDGRIAAALDAVGLGGFEERRAESLSGGEVQRVALARAIAIDPAVLLLDEPTANVDRAHVEIVELLTADFSKRGRTVVLSTHDLEQAYRLGERVIALAGGRPTASPLINVLRGTVERAGAATYFLSGGLRVEIPEGASPRAIAIDPEDILVSLSSLESSARNCFAGQIAKVENDARGILLTVDCGPSLIARVTRHSYEEMALNIGARVFVTFKATAVHT